jgi:hypothetical protein
MDKIVKWKKLNTLSKSPPPPPKSFVWLSKNVKKHTNTVYNSTTEFD